MADSLNALMDGWTVKGRCDDALIMVIDVGDGGGDATVRLMMMVVDSGAGGDGDRVVDSQLSVSLSLS